VTTSFEWDQGRGTLVLNAFAAAPDGAQALDPHDFTQAAMTALVAAELLAASAGIVPYVPVTAADGTQTNGVINIGAARNTIYLADPATRTGYMATQVACAKAQGIAVDAATTTPSLAVPAAESGVQVPLLVPLVVIGIAAILAGAAYLAYTSGKQIEVAGQNLRAIYAAKIWNDTAKNAIDKGITLPSSFWGALGPIVNGPNETATPWWKPAAIAGGLIATVTGGVLLYQNVPGVRRALKGGK
jgi:hypothetical protein